MDHKWLEDAFDAFQQENDGLDYESLMQMMLAIEYWAEEHKLGLTEARRSAKIRKRMFDAAKELVTEGFTPCQVALILQDGPSSCVSQPRDMNCVLHKALVDGDGVRGVTRLILRGVDG
jgi:uncharacterized glyoxalase superfamily metalloenzyme YdcJ